MELRISDVGRARYTRIHGKDPLASDGWLTRRMKRELAVLGCEIAEDVDLLDTLDGHAVEAPAVHGRALVQIERRRDRDASVFAVSVGW